MSPEPPATHPPFEASWRDAIPLNASRNGSVCGVEMEAHKETARLQVTNSHVGKEVRCKLKSFQRRGRRK